jgi:hypothetical protein
MRLLQVDRLELYGGNRVIEFGPGLNVVYGPIATGKSTVVKLIRALFGTIPDDLPPEITNNVSALRSAVTLGTGRWNILRRLVTTDTALVEVVGESDSLLLPAAKPTRSHPGTYSSWLLRILDMPETSVPAAPSRPESDPTPVTFTDFLNYCILRGDEIDNSVFGSHHPFRDIKRRYVFEIVYGLYDTSIAEMQRRLRLTENQLNYLRGERAVAERIFAGTELQSIEAVRVELDRRRTAVAELRDTERREVSVATTANPLDVALRKRVEDMSDELATLERNLKAAESQLSDLDALVTQLQSQQAKIVRAIVAGDVLVDFEFILCPRCGQPIGDQRADSDHCTLCLQATPTPQDPAALASERDRIEEQIVDTVDLIDLRRQAITELHKAIADTSQARATAGRQLDQAMASFISDRQVEIARISGQRAKAQAELEKFEQYLVILERSEVAKAQIAQLSEERDKLRLQLEDASSKLRLGQANVSALERRFHEYLQRLRIPTFGAPLTAKIASRSYKPIVAERHFDSLSSQGLQVLVNVAHALAHHTVAIDRDLPLPGLLVIDGPSSNVGTVGYDAERLSDMYSLLEDVAKKYAGSLQIIVVDNNVPPSGRAWIKLPLSEDDRLVRLPGSDASAGSTAA